MTAVRLDQISKRFGDTVALDRISLQSSADTMQETSIYLSTMHAIKGLEAHTVFIVGMEEGMVPHNRSLDDPADIEEERRLAYVAMTRAETHLYLSHCNVRRLFGNTILMLPSRFLSEFSYDVKHHDFTTLPARPQLQAA